LESLFAQKRFPEALTFAEKLIGDYPNSYHISFINVKILKELNRLREAEAAALKLIHLAPDNINLLLELGTICLKLTKYNESYDYFNKVLFLDPFNSEARESLDKIKGLQKVNGGSELKEKKLMDFISRPGKDDKVFEKTVPGIQEERISTLESIEPGEDAAVPPGIVEQLEPIEQIGPTDQFEEMNSYESSDSIESIDSIESPGSMEIESMESIDVNELNEPGEFIPQTPASMMSPPMDFENVPEFTSEIKELNVEAPGIEDGEMAEIPGIEDAAQEIDSIGTPNADPYAQYFNEENVETMEEPAQEEVIPMPQMTQTTGKEEPGDDEEFVTESAADLYLTQGLFDDALRIYEKLYAVRKEGRFLLKVKQLRSHQMGQEKIRRLELFLKTIQMKGV
jgi:tetratricopeptide (TPR) repeat protein